MKRTDRQNNSLHLYLRQLAEALRDAGYDMREVRVPIMPTEENVKEAMWRPVMRAMYPDIESTTQLSTTQIQEVYKVLDHAMGERLGIHVEFPSEESLMEAQR